MVRRLAVVVWLGGCAAAPKMAPQNPTQPKTIELEPLRIDVAQGEGGPKTTVYDARALLDEGNDALIQKKYDDALIAYEHLIDDFPDSKLIVSAVYNSGLALEGKGDFAGAVDRYRKVMALNAPKDSEDLLNAEYRLGAVLAELQRYPESIAVWDKVLERDDLKPADRIEALARLGFALVQTKDYAGGEEVLRQALAYTQKIQGTTRLPSFFFVGMAQFYLAEIPHQQFNAVPLRYPQQQMMKDLDQKTQLFDLARDRYMQAVEIKDPYWATAAVYQIGQMYREFWDDFMAVPPPPDFDADTTKEYVRAINDSKGNPQAHVLWSLLEKAMTTHAGNVTMAKHANVNTAWSQESEKQANEIAAILARHANGELFQPGQKKDGTPTPVTPTAGAPETPPSEYLPARINL